MADAKQPQLPEGTPENIRTFVECTSDKLELKPGKVDWLPLDVAPDAKFTPPKGQKDKVDVELGVFGQKLATIPVAVNGGRLSVDTSGWPELLPGKAGVDTWVRDLNDWMASRKKKFGGLTVKDGNVVITKVALDAAGAAAPPATPKEGSGLKTKVAVAGAAAALLVAGVGLMIANRDEGKTTATASTAANPPAVATDTGSASEASSDANEPMSFLPYEVYSSCIGVDVNGNTTDLLATGTLVNLLPGTYKGTMTTGNGPVNGAGDVPAGAPAFQVRFHFTQFTTIEDLQLTAPDGTPIRPGAFLLQLLFELNSASNKPTDCDASELDSPTTAGPEQLVRGFLSELGAYLRERDEVLRLVHSLDHTVIERYGVGQCEAHVPTLVDPTQNFVMKSFQGPIDYVYASDGQSTTAPNTFTVDVLHTRNGQTNDEEIHLHEEGDQLYWFTDCGDPVAAAPN
jgi:hypothetical protein